MKRTPTELAYVKAAVENASPAGLVVILFDQLIKDLQGAIAAMQKNNIEVRTAELNHGFLVLEQLEGSLNMESGGDAAKHLSRFYATVRAGMLNAHVQVSPGILQRQIELLFEIRQAWETADRNLGQEKSNVPAPASSAFSAQTTDEDDRVPANWHA
jgi:flagellar protein FliS